LFSIKKRDFKGYRQVLEVDFTNMPSGSSSRRQQKPSAMSIKCLMLENLTNIYTISLRGTFQHESSTVLLANWFAQTLSVVAFWWSC